MMNKRLLTLVALFLTGLMTLVSQSASLLAQQDPQPPWQGTLTVATQRHVLVGEQMSLQVVASEAPLAPNGHGESIGVYGHNSQWVNISPYGHVVPTSSVVNITANPGFSQGWDLNGEANPLWQGNTLQSCEVYLLDSADGQLRRSGVFVPVHSQVGVYAVLGDLIQVSPWLHFLNGDCATGTFPKPAEPVVTGGGYINGVQPYTIPMTDSMLSGCDEPHEISGEHVQPDGTILVICKQAAIQMPNGGEVVLWSLGALVGFVSPIPGDGAAVVTAWIARAGKAGVVAIGVASTAVTLQQIAPAMATVDLPPFHPALPSTFDWQNIDWVINQVDPGGQILLSKNADHLPDPPSLAGVPEYTEHLKSHPRGEYTAKLKRWGWAYIFHNWYDAWTNGGKPPDWCGIRPSDGAKILVYYSLELVTATGKVYRGFMLLLHSNGVGESTVFPKVVPGQDGKPFTGNSGMEPADEFTPIPFDQCGPPPPMVTN